MSARPVLIIGGGATGAGLARDLALRNVPSVLVEKKDINAGASGGNHGLLHSGARYIGTDPAAARECRREGRLLKKMAAECIEDVGGLFVAAPGDDENYVADFPNKCAECEIQVQPVDIAEARELEPSLSANLIAAYAVEDASLDPFRLSYNNVAQAAALGADIRIYSRVTGMDVSGRRIISVRVRDEVREQEEIFHPEIVVNATGAWADHVAAMVGAHIDMILSKGALLVTPRRLASRVINRLRKASDSDILVPGGTVSILGTTSIRVDDPDDIHPEIHEIDEIIREGAVMVPELETLRYIRAYCGVRPLVRSGEEDYDRDVSRGYYLIDHAADGIDNFITITGGKLTTYRLMAEMTADLVCHRLGVTAPCLTRTEPLPDHSAARWTEPGASAREAFRRKDASDLNICDCEMVPVGVVDDLIRTVRRQKEAVGMVDIQHRSRLGKGSCQGTFCSQRLVAHLYDSGTYQGEEGLPHIKEFVQERWRGQHPVLWDLHMAQADLQEAIQCGLLNLELAGAQPVKNGR